MKERREYEAKAEIIVKQLKAKLYQLEAKALEAKLKADKGFEVIEKKIKNIVQQREDLDKKFADLKNAGTEKWKQLVIDFEDFLRIVNEDKEDFYDKAEDWMNDFSAKIEQLEEKAKHANEELKVKIKEQIKNLKEYKSVLDQKFIHLKDSQDDNWQKIKKGFDDGLITMKDSINKAFDYFKK